MLLRARGRALCSWAFPLLEGAVGRDRRIIPFLSKGSKVTQALSA